MSYPELLFENEGEQLRWGPNGPERVKLQEQMGPLERSSSNFSDRKGMGGTTPNQKSFMVQPAQAPRAPTAEELMARAQAIIDATADQSRASQENPTLGERDAAGNRLPDWLTRSMKDQ